LIEYGFSDASAWAAASWLGIVATEYFRDMTGKIKWGIL
jgi:hypothetical protein